MNNLTKDDGFYIYKKRKEGERGFEYIPQCSHPTSYKHTILAKKFTLFE